jgi:hypothetical protein
MLSGKLPAGGKGAAFEAVSLLSMSGDMPNSEFDRNANLDGRARENPKSLSESGGENLLIENNQDALNAGRPAMRSAGTKTSCSLVSAV